MPSTEINTESVSDVKVVVVPAKSLENITNTVVKFVQLRHPRTGSGTCFMYNETNKTLFEVMTCQEEHRSWFIGDKVVQDGKLMLVTPINPVFLAIPYMIKAERLVPLDQMLQDEEYKHTEDILISTLTETRLGLVSDSKGSKDLNVWKYSQEKTLTWLESKVRQLSESFEKTAVDTTGGASSSIYKVAAADEFEYLRYALGVVSEYLDSNLESELQHILNIPKLETKVNNKRLSSVDIEDDTNKPRKKAKVEEPLEDYSKPAKKAAVKEETNAKQKALAQSAKGTKSIMSFFGKK